MKNNLIILLDAQGNLITEPIGQLRANAEFNADITVIAPFDLTTVVSATFTKNNRVERDITQYLVPDGTIRGKDRLDKDHPEYQRVYDYNVFEGSMNDVALAYVAKFRAGLLFMSIGLGDIVQPPLAINYKGKFGQGVYLPEEAENGDFYICDEYNFNDKDFTFTLDDYAYFYNGKWHKSNYRSLGGTDTFEVSVSPNLKSNVEVTIDQDLGLLLAGRVAVLERAVNDLEGDYIELEARVTINEQYIDDIKLKDIDQDNRLDIIESDIEDIEEVDRNQNNKLQDHETRITKNTQDIAAINEGLVKIDDKTITRNDDHELEVSDLVLNDINSRVEETDFISYQNTVQDFLNGKLDKKPDGVIDLINAFNKIDARYLEIDNELFIVVLELPEIGKGNKIYLVPKTGTDNNNKYDEYIYIDNKWEALGTITIDLSNYYDKNEINTLLNDKVDKVSGKGLSTNDFTNNDKNKLDGIEAGAEVNPYSKNQLDNMLGDKVDISKQVAKTPDMIGRVGVDNDGSLWYAPFIDDIIKVREMNSLDSMVSYEGTLQPNLTHVDNGDIRVYSNTFDHVFPYNEMIESVDLFNNKFVDVPVIYWKFYQDTLGNLTGYDISNKKIDDTFDTFPVHAKGKLSIGKYQAYSQDGKLYSISAVDPSMSKTIESFRTEAKAVGDDYFSNDWQSWNILQLLLTAYFGTKNTDLYFPDVNGAKSNTGTMDGYKTAVNLATGKNAFFGIENIVKNGYHFIDGVINNNEEVWFANDHTKYSNEITEDYVLKGTKPTQEGYIKNYGGGLGLFPTENTGASSTTYYCDYLWYAADLRVLFSGSDWDASANLGVWGWVAVYDFSYTSSVIGSRLIKTS